MRSLNRRQFVLSGAVAMASGVVTGPSNRRQRNILVLISDDQSPIAGSDGYPVIRAPNLDR